MTEAAINDTLDFLESHDISDDDDDDEGAGVAGVSESQLTETDVPLQFVRSGLVSVHRVCMRVPVLCVFVIVIHLTSAENYLTIVT